MRISKELFQNIRHIQFVTHQLANDVLAGAYRSAFKGKGMEFEEVREYQRGDEVRNIDWNVTARMNHPFIKIFREERDLTVFLICDISASCKFGSVNKTKAQVIAEIGALLSFSAIKNQDKVGLLLFSDKIEKYIPPKKGLKHVLLIIRELLAFQGQNKGTDIAKALDYFGKVQTEASICFLISDFIAPPFSKEAFPISKKHDLISIMVEDPLEVSFPKMNLVRVKDLETDELFLIDSNAKEVQNYFSEDSQKIKDKISKIMKKIGSGFIYIRSDKPYLNAIQKFFKIRKLQRR
jgi:uncharacterized protein (DUF58 family)